MKIKKKLRNLTYKTSGTIKYQTYDSLTQKKEKKTQCEVTETINKIIIEFFQNLGMETAMQLQKTFQIPNRNDQKKTSCIHIMVKILNIQNKEKYRKLQEGTTCHI
jgi:Fe-S oxidoreductase